MKNQNKHVTQIREFVSAGTRPKIDLRSAELNLANAELALVRAKNGVELAKVALNAAMGVEGPIDYDVADPAEQQLPEESRPVTDLLPEALHQRPEMVRADAELRAQVASRRVAKSAYYPAFQAFGNVNGSKVDDTKNGDLDWIYNWYVGAGLSWNLYSGSLTTKQVEETEAAEAQVAAQREQTRQSIRSDLEQQLISVSEAKERIRVSDRAVTTADERLKLAEGRYQAGAGDVIELDDAQIAQFNARAARVSAQYDLATARARLLRALGRK
jgi:outer membrane protein